MPRKKLTNTILGYKGFPEINILAYFITKDTRFFPNKKLTNTIILGYKGL